MGSSPTSGTYYNFSCSTIKFIINMKKFIYSLLCIFTMFVCSSCHGVMPDADEEAVLIAKPWFFGHGGVDMDPVTTGCTWCWWSTSSETFKITPQRYDEAFDDIFSNDNTPLDFNSYINIQIKPGQSPVLLKNYGVRWYETNIQVQYRNYTREEVSKYSPFDLISNREVLVKIDSAVITKMEKLLAKLSNEKEFPIVIKSVTTGAAKPNKDQLDEMNATAAAIQKTKTQERNKEMEIARAEAEHARAEADKAYMSAMNLSAGQFIELKYIEMIASKKDANIDVLVGGGASSMWNVRRQ